MPDLFDYIALSGFLCLLVAVAIQFGPVGVFWVLGVGLLALGITGAGRKT